MPARSKRQPGQARGPPATAPGYSEFRYSLPVFYAENRRGSRDFKQKEFAEDLKKCLRV
jgi:hypothetical protein